MGSSPRGEGGRARLPPRAQLNPMGTPGPTLRAQDLSVLLETGIPADSVSGGFRYFPQRTWKPRRRRHQESGAQGSWLSRASRAQGTAGGGWKAPGGRGGGRRPEPALGPATGLGGQRADGLRETACSSQKTPVGALVAQCLQPGASAFPGPPKSPRTARGSRPQVSRCQPQQRGDRLQAHALPAFCSLPGPHPAPLSRLLLHWLLFFTNVSPCEHRAVAQCFEIGNCILKISEP